MVFIPLININHHVNTSTIQSIDYDGLLFKWSFILRRTNLLSKNCNQAFFSKICCKTFQKKNTIRELWSVVSAYILLLGKNKEKERKSCTKAWENAKLFFLPALWFFALNIHRRIFYSRLAECGIRSDCLKHLKKLN